MRARYLAGLLFLLILTPLQAANPLVDVDWLLANLNNSNLKGLNLQPEVTYQRFHVPCAVNNDYSWSGYLKAVIDPQKM